MRIVWLVIGFISLGLGTLGVFLPVLPTVPFFMLTTFCFLKGSKRMHDWFIETKLYRRYLKQLATRNQMTLKAKIITIISFSLVMGFGFIMMKKVLIGRVALIIVWILHMIYFVFKVDTVEESEND